jgi:hypothetical protein
VLKPLPRAIGGLVLAAAALPWLATAASADPSGSSHSFSFPATCTDGSGVAGLQFVVNSANGGGSGTENNPKGQANFSPAHVVGNNAIFHPTAFDLVFTFAATGGPTFTSHDTASQPNGRRSTSCTIHFTQTQADGTFSLDGTVVGWFS